MYDYSPILEDFQKIPAAAEVLAVDDLRRMTNEMIDTMETLIDGCSDEDVTFQPSDPDANDTYASDKSEVHDAWTLGHVLVHVTASSEESAALAAEMARGVEREGRSRYETPWRSVETMEQVRQRLSESRRMRLASLDMWPNEPHLDLHAAPFPGAPAFDARGRFFIGLVHDASHLDQIRDIVQQAHA